LRALPRLADTLRGRCREYDFLARLGGDELILVLPGLGREDLAGTLDRMREEAEANLAACHPQFPLEVLVGDAVFPDNGGDAEGLLAEADSRLSRGRHSLLPVRRRAPAYDPGERRMAPVAETLSQAGD
jgi:diguanylate cyclase (GGDEF)-like protein